MCEKSFEGQSMAFYNIATVKMCGRETKSRRNRITLVEIIIGIN